MKTFTFNRGLLPAIFSIIVLSLVLAIPAGAGEREAEQAGVPDSPPAGTSADRPEASIFGLDTALGLVGLPGMSSAADDDESTYEKAWRMQNGPNGTTRLSYGEQYRRNPDGSYGAQSSSRWNGGNVADNLLEQALSAGSGWFSSWAEGFLGGYGKARLSFRLNDEGEVTGAGDFLLPLYDSEYSTFFTQLGLRTMPGDRVIGNFGLGQRFFPAEKFAFGYNAFLDQDFSRDHTRGGAGVEAWYDWLRLSANYYTPLSGWKDSRDYDRRLVEERPAEGYDARLTGYLPFYRNLAVTGAFEQWKGDHVGSFGSDDVVQKDPQVWSYGLEWTPIPAFSTSVNQRHSGGQKETQFGLTFNYHFGMAWDDQLSPATVSEMRTVDGSRHDFVNRQNEIILAYRAKEGAFNITPRGTGGQNIFVFQITNGFGESVAGQRVTVSLPAGVVDSGGGAYITDGNGLLNIALLTVPASAVPTSATLTAGKTSRTFRLGSTGTATASVLTFTVTGENKNFNSTAENYQSTIEVTLKEYDDGSGPKTLPTGAFVVWSVKSVNNPSAAWWLRSVTAKNGLTWGDSADGTSWWGWTSNGGGDDYGVEGSVPTSGMAQLTDVVGSRSVTLEASVCIGGSGGEATATACSGNSGNWYTGERTVSFGAGPLSVFNTAPVSGVQWATASGAKDTVTYDTTGLNTADGSQNWGDFAASSTNFPAIAAVGGTPPNRAGFTYGGTSSGNWTVTQWPSGWKAMGSYHYAEGSRLPTVEQLLAVAKYSGSNPSILRKGAAFAAGWPDDSVGSGYYMYWSGEVRFDDVGRFVARLVSLNVGFDDSSYDVGTDVPVAVGVGP